MGVSSNRLCRVLQHYVDAAVERMNCAAVSAIGVDETSTKKLHDYISCFFYMETRRLVFATEGREHEIVAAFARFIGAHGGDVAAVRDVSCDMSPAFIKGVKESLSNSDITFDRFHIAKILGDAVERVRRSEWRRDKTIKGARYALLKYPDTLTNKQRAYLDDIMTRNSA